MGQDEIVKADPSRGAAYYAAQLLEIMAMWGMTKDMARRVGSAIATTAASLSEQEFSRLSGGAQIKGGRPAMGSANDEGNPS